MRKGSNVYRFVGVDNQEHYIYPCPSNKLPELKAWFHVLELLIKDEDNQANFSHLYCKNLEVQLVCDRILYVCDIDPTIVSIDGLFALTVMNRAHKDPSPCYLKVINSLV